MGLNGFKHLVQALNPLSTLRSEAGALQDLQESCLKKAVGRPGGLLEVADVVSGKSASMT